MGNVAAGVYPCYENQFQVNTVAAGAEANMVPIADCTTFSATFNNGVQEWNPFDQQGWRRALMTSKAINISVTAKRNIGDAGNDAIAAMATKSGRDAERDFQWTFPDGTAIKFPNAVISVTNAGAGDATNVAELTFEVISNGKPEIIPAA